MPIRTLVLRVPKFTLPATRQRSNPDSPAPSPSAAGWRSKVLQACRKDTLDRAQRKAFVPHPYGLLRLLSQSQTTFIAGSQLTDTAGGGTAIAGRSLLDSAGRRIASPILACRVIVNAGLPGLFAAAGLLVTVKQRASRVIPGFFMAMFSVGTQFDACVIG